MTLNTLVNAFHRKPIEQRPSVPRKEAQICGQCETIFSYRHYVKGDGTLRCPICTSQQCRPLFLFLEQEPSHLKHQRETTRKLIEMTEKREEQRKRWAEVKKSMRIEDNVAYIATSIKEPGEVA
jgi:hypothetical protein